MAAYRRDDFADPDSYLAQLGMVLQRYDDRVVDAVTSPIGGMQREYKFPPSIAEAAQFCEEFVARGERIERYSSFRTEHRSARAPVEMATVFVPVGAPIYAAMLEMSLTGDKREFRHDPGGRSGIWVSPGWLARVSTAKPRTAHDIEAACNATEAS